MKTLFFSLLFTTIIFNVSAQLKATPQCPEMVVNIEDGSVNKMQPNASPGLIEKTFPCFTSMEAETDSAAKCGGLIAFSDKDIYFYTSRDYIEIGEKYKGKLSIPLLGAVRADLFKWLGYPKIKDITWDAFPTAYGVLVVYYDAAGKINKIQISTKSVETIKLCP